VNAPSSKHDWVVHKFGGTSVADADCFRRVAGLLHAQSGLRQAVVVSAMGGMTNALLALVEGAVKSPDSIEAGLAAIRERYTQTVDELISDTAARQDLLKPFEQELGETSDILNAVALVRSAAQRSRDVVAGYGEIWSTRLLAAYLEQLQDDDPQQRAVAWMDARQILVVEPGELGPAVLWDQSRALLDEHFPQHDAVIVIITGFIASDPEGLQTTLGRNGSDYSASIIGTLLKAAAITIWTDVAGVMSADPSRVPEAAVIHELTYSEAMELAYFGAKVIHPQTLGPAVENDIPVVIRNSFNLAHPGSRIEADSVPGDNIKGITAIGGMALLNLEGSGMIGVPGTADRLFASLKSAGVSVTLISQASSEHSICIAVPEDLAERARQVVSETFADELESGQIQSVDVTEAQSIVAVVGDGMAGTPGIAGRFFGTLGRAGINIRAIAQGSSERNISAVVDSEQATKALRAVHSGFYLSAKTISIGLIGPGTVGSTLLQQIEKQNEKLAQNFNLDLRVRAISNSRKMLLGDRRIELADWEDEFRMSSVDADLDAFTNHLKPDHLPHAVIIDCTASDVIAAKYSEWLARGIHVSTPNKKAFSSSYGDYQALQNAADEGSSHYFYETTVGAALPVITTLCDLIHTGDEVRSISGIFSGTLAYLFNVYDGSTPFSEIVRAAKESGYTEPDPRDDLSGMDAARKLTILAPELGQKIEIGDFPVHNLVPEALRHCSIDEFLETLSAYDNEMQDLYAQAAAENKRLRYVANLNASGDASVGLISVEQTHPFCNINLTDNIVQFETERYSANPLVIQGPGAGPEVTAAGIFADLLRLTNFLSTGEGYV